MELVDTPDLGSGGESRGGSSPFTRTNLKLIFLIYCKIELYDVEHFMDEISYGNNGNQERRIEAGI